MIANKGYTLRSPGLVLTHAHIRFRFLRPKEELPRQEAVAHSDLRAFGPDVAGLFVTDFR